MTATQALREHVKEHGCDCPDAPECDRPEHHADDGTHLVPGGGRCERAQYLRALADEQKAS